MGVCRCCCSLLVAAAERLSWTKSARAAKLYDTVRLLWSRHTSDDLLFIFLVLIDAFVMEVAGNYILIVEKIVYVAKEMPFTQKSCSSLNA